MWVNNFIGMARKLAMADTSAVGAIHRHLRMDGVFRLMPSSLAMLVQCAKRFAQLLFTFTIDQGKHVIMRANLRISGWSDELLISND
jgi:hypothetical protein